MATKAPAKPAVAAPAGKGGTKTITRKRRNSLERKSLPKFLKVTFLGSAHSTFKGVLAAWKESRRKTGGESRF